jgi:hypothetical protein
MNAVTNIKPHFLVCPSFHQWDVLFEKHEEKRIPTCIVRNSTYDDVRFNRMAAHALLTKRLLQRKNL